MKYSLLLLVFFSVHSFSQITGLVIDKNNEPLPFVSIYVKDTYTGTTTNNDGNYIINLTKTGDYTLIFQFLGYKTVKKEISVSRFPYVLNVTLSEDAVALNEVVVSSKENPANKIIRSAIAKRKENLQKTEKFTADFYSRGIFRIKDAPEKILGQIIGDMGGGLDSTRSGVIYLSETISKISKNQKKFKERILASKVSGNDNGFSFNQASDVNFNLYENLIEINDANIISPIALYAFNYYKYQLINSYYEDEHLINKIKVTPKRTTDNAFNGFIYIIENNWQIYAAELSVTGKQLQEPVLDKLIVKQNYSHSKKDKLWSLFSQSIDFKFGMFGFNVDGRVTAVYSNYSFEPAFTKKSFTNEVLAFEDNANKKDTVFWNTVRPVPLTLEEVKDYHLKDSIKVIRKSKKYLDSVDLKQNKFKVSNLLFGYTYHNSYKDWNLSIGSPILNSMFNTVQGWHTNMDVSFFKNYKEKHQRLWVNTILDYGFSDKQFRASGKFTYQFNQKTRPFISVAGGRKMMQFNASNPISPVLNAASSLFFERNYAKFYDNTFARVEYGKEIVNGLRFNTSLSYEDRKPVFNTTDYVTLNRDAVIYSSNNPLDPTNFTTAAFTKHNIYKFNLETTINFGQEYISLPDRKFNIGTLKYPRIKLQYTKGFGASEAKYNYDFVQANLYQHFSIGNKGTFAYNLTAGTFLETDELSFIDYKHFNGNQTHINLSGSYTPSYYLLPYYDLSSNNEYAEAHVQHHFGGYLLRKIPLFNKLQWELVLGGKALLTKDNKPYTEYSIGLDNIGFGKFRFLRVDYVRTNFNGVSGDGFMFGFSF